MTDRAATPGYMKQNSEGSALVAAVRTKFRDEFGWPSGELASRYDTTGSTAQPAVGGTRMDINSGTAANGVCQALLPLPFAAPAQVVIAAQFSQANPANCDASIELVDAQGQVCAAFVFPGTNTPIQCRVNTFNKYRLAPPENGNTLAISDRTALRLYAIQLYPDEIRFSQRDPNSNNGRNTLSVRTYRIPDPDEQLFLRFKMVNGVTPPASATNLMVHSVSITDINELPVDLTNTGGSAASESVPVNVVQSAAVGAIPQPSTGVGSYNTFARGVTAASTNATVSKGSATGLGGGAILNTSAAAMYFKVFNKNAAPIVGTDAPVLTVLVPANSQVSLDDFIPSMGLRLSAGLAWCLTAGPLHTDTVAVAAGSIVELFYV